MSIAHDFWVCRSCGGSTVSEFIHTSHHGNQLPRASGHSNLLLEQIISLATARSGSKVPAKVFHIGLGRQVPAFALHASFGSFRFRWRTRSPKALIVMILHASFLSQTTMTPEILQLFGTKGGRTRSSKCRIMEILQDRISGWIYFVRACGVSANLSRGVR